MTDDIKQAAADEIAVELQSIFDLVAGEPSEADGWYSINRMREIAIESGQPAGKLTKEAFRFRIKGLYEEGYLERMQYRSRCFYRAKTEK